MAFPFAETTTATAVLAARGTAGAAEEATAAAGCQGTVRSDQDTAMGSASTDTAAAVPTAGNSSSSNIGGIAAVPATSSSALL